MAQVETEMTKWKRRIFNEWETNEVVVSGRIETELEYSYQVMREKYYHTKIRVKRLSMNDDVIPIVISELLINKNDKQALVGEFVKIRGQFRSHNEWGADGRKHLKLFLFVTDIVIYKNKNKLDKSENMNLIYIDGIICNTPVYRNTSTGKEITDLRIKVNRENNKSDCIPCISWGKVAKIANMLKKGDRVKIYGRIQSRKYFKKYSENSEEGEFREAYEVSIMKMHKAYIEN